MSYEEDDTASQLTDKQKIDIAKWFLLNSPAGEIQYIAKGKIWNRCACMCVRMAFGRIPNLISLVSSLNDVQI